MKRFFFNLLIAGILFTAFQTRAYGADSPLAAQRDSLSYVYGINYGGYLWTNNFRSLYEAPFTEGVKDYLKAAASGAKTGTPEFKRFLKEDFGQINAVTKKFSDLVSNKSEVPTELRTQVSYLLGSNLANAMINEGLTDLDVPQLIASTLALTNTDKDINSDEFFASLRIHPGVQQELIKRYKESRRIFLNEKNIALGEAYLKDFMALPGAKLTPEGIAYIIDKPGTGAKIKNYDYNISGSYKECHVDGRVIIDAAMQDRDLWNSTEGFRIAVREAGAGGTIRAVVPAKYAYGEKGSSNLGIEPGETLLYEIDVKKLTAYKREIYD